ncbi:hypothetical protein ALC53_04328 [Atta colombica]|uniref:Uncharacterized protein n=1 Tax=Atta colombica TaxID=520822 RepID=A0A151I552_9HYME|nr:hypothetical protein ALC53_04328 [Atta colombica]
MLGWLKTVEIVEAYGTDHCWISFQTISSALSAASIRRIRSRKALNNSYPASSSLMSVSAENCRLDLAMMMPPSVAVAARKSFRELAPETMADDPSNLMKPRIITVCVAILHDSSA